MKQSKKCIKKGSKDMGAPFIDLFKVTNNYYLYDVNSNKVALISKQLADILMNNNGSSVEEISKKASLKEKKEITSLIENGMLSDRKPQDIEHPATIFLRSYTDNYVESLTLQVTQSCNLRCRYCGYSDETNLERKHSNSRMSWETARKALNYYFQHSSLSQEAVVAFYGGEPLLEFFLIKKVVTECEKMFKHKKRAYKVTTNCTFLTDEMVKFFDRYNFFVTVSLDGPERIHDKNRRFLSNGTGSFEKVVHNFLKLKNGINDYERKLNVNAVFDPEEEYQSYLDFFKSEIFKGTKVEFSPIDYSKLKYNIIPNKKFEFEKYNCQIRSYLHLMNPSDNMVTDQDLTLQKTIKQVESIKRQFSSTISLMEKEHHSGPCVPGFSNCFVNVDGTIFPCEKVCEVSHCMCIGNIDDGYDYDKMNSILNIGKITRDKCLKCTAIRHCNICANTIDDITGFDYSTKIRKCQEQKIHFRKQIEKYVLLCQMGLIKNGIVTI